MVSSRSAKNTSPVADGVHGDVVEIHLWDQQYWALAHVIAYRQLPPDGELVPEAVGLFNPPEDQGINNLAESPEGFGVYTIEMASWPGDDDEEQTVDDEKREKPNRCQDVFFLTNYGNYGLLYDCKSDRRLVWRFAESMTWPPLVPWVNNDEEADFMGMQEEHLGIYDPKLRRKRSSKSSSRHDSRGSHSQKHSSHEVMDVPPIASTTEALQVADGGVTSLPATSAHSITRAGSNSGLASSQRAKTGR